jgi:hypothetical protein
MVVSEKRIQPSDVGIIFYLSTADITGSTTTLMAGMHIAPFEKPYMITLGVPNDLDVLLVMTAEFTVEVVPALAQVLFDHVQARLHFHADVFWTKASIAPQVLHLWLDTYQTGKDFTRRWIVEGVVT